MSELEGRFREEQKKSEIAMIERLYEANKKFDADVEEIVFAPEGKKWPWWAHVVWYLFVALVLYLLVAGILAL